MAKKIRIGKSPKAPKLRTPKQIQREKASDRADASELLDSHTIRNEVKLIDELIPATYNPRSITNEARKGLYNSIKRFGLVQPIVWNERTGRVVGGHQRLDILRKEFGKKEVDTVVVSLNPKEEKALNVALNHKGIQGDFIEEELHELVAGLDEDIVSDLNLDEVMTITEWEDDLPEDDSPFEAEEKGGVIKVSIPSDHAYLTAELVQYFAKMVESHYPDKGIMIK